MVSPAVHGSQDGSPDLSGDEGLHSGSQTNSPPASRSSISGVSYRERDDAPSSRDGSPILSGKIPATLVLEEGILEESSRYTPDKSSPASVSQISVSSARRSHDLTEGQPSSGRSESNCSRRFRSHVS